MVGSDGEALQLAAALQASMQEAGQQPLECEAGFELALVPDGEEEALQLAAALHSSMQEQEGIGLEVELELVQEQERASEEELAQTLCAIAPPVATQNSDEAIAAVAAFMAADGSALLVTPSQHDPFPSAPRRVPSFQPFMEIPPAVVRGISSEAERMGTEREATDAEIRRLAEQFEEQERLAELGPGAFACPICLEEDVPGLAGHQLGCGHTFCTACIGSHVRARAVKIDACPPLSISLSNGISMAAVPLTRAATAATVSRSCADKSEGRRGRSLWGGADMSELHKRHLDPRCARAHVAVRR